MYVLNFLNLSDLSFMAAQRHFGRETAWPEQPQVYYRHLESGQWQGPVPLITWGHGYACVSLPSGPYWLPVRFVKPARIGKPSAQEIQLKNEGTAADP